MQQCKSMLRSACHSAFCTDGETGILTEGDRAYTGNRMRILIVAGLTLTASLTVVTQAHAEVHLTIRDGRVTLNAAGATVHDILAEWAKIGQTKIVNAERIAGGPLTLQPNGRPRVPTRAPRGPIDSSSRRRARRRAPRPPRHSRRASRSPSFRISRNCRL